MTFDPLAQLRAPDAPAFDVFLHGMVFLDIIFTGMDEMPGPGEEIWSDGMGSCPGGIANLAVATSRLGLRTSLGAAFSTDDYGEFCWRTLRDQEGVDLSASARYPEWHSPVTVSMAVGDDRQMVTHGHPAPQPASQMIGTPPAARACIVDLHPETPIGDDADPTWADQARAQGSLLFADVGFDQTGVRDTSVLDQLQYCHAFTPNQLEAMAYTRTETPSDALYAIADRVPLAVVTEGPNGARAIDSVTGEEAVVPALRVRAVDPTGAGDVFCAALVLGSLAGWPLDQRLAFSALCSSLSVQQVGGSLAAPGWGDIADWWHKVRDGKDERICSLPRTLVASMRRRYEFLDDLVATVPSGAVRRAAATIAQLSDA
ncbi:carbohydrate kinase family protein [Luteococcus sanguinis]|uniref:Carbohydrate kinase family protein n=1 Tax=Luteococcus sanguinis TaxID=174038 RepID=A0ABW1X466_9ACTN